MEVGADRRGATFACFGQDQSINIVDRWKQLFQCKDLNRWQNKLKVGLDLIASDENRERIQAAQNATNTAADKWSLLEAMSTVLDADLNLVEPY